MKNECLAQSKSLISTILATSKMYDQFDPIDLFGKKKILNLPFRVDLFIYNYAMGVKY